MSTPGDAVVICQQAVTRYPLAAQAHYDLGMAYLRLGQHKAAVPCFKRAVALKAEYAEAWYQLGYTHSLLTSFQEAIACDRRAVALKPDYAAASNNIGYAYLRLGDVNAAIRSFRQSVVAEPNYAKAHSNLGLGLLNQGQFEAAVPALQKAIQLQPDFVEALTQLGLAYLKLDRPAEAARCLQQALAFRPDQPDIYYSLGNAHSHLNGPDEAVAYYQKSIVLSPDFVEAHYFLGLVYSELSRYDEASASLKTVLRLKPDYAEAYSNLGTVLLKGGQLDEATGCFQKAVCIHPGYAEAYNNLASVFTAQGRWGDVIVNCQKALTLRPTLVEAYNNLGMVQLILDAVDEAIFCFRQALALKPDFMKAFYNLGYAFLKAGQVDVALECQRRALSLQPVLAPPFDSILFTLNYLPASSPTAIYEEHRRYAEQFETPFKLHWPAHAHSRDPDRRLKIGYVSGDLCQHSVAFFLEPLLAHHDQREVEVFCYYNNTLQDTVTALFQAYADHWIPCKVMTDDQLAARIQADGIDILVDLSGHTAANRLLVFARKPAPVQVTYLGYPATTGLSAIDYRLVTSDTDPVGAERWHSENLYRLPRSLWCYRPAAAMPAVIAETPARRSDVITFGSMNNLAKISDTTLVVWSRLLQAVPGARLVLTNVPPGTAQQHLLVRFAEQGIGAERLTVHGKLPNDSYYALLNTIDIALDPFPYSGTTTTCECLWMGVPMVSLIGESSVTRSGYALLKTIGLENLAARDVDEYVALATNLAQDLDRLDTLRNGIRARIVASPLLDEAGMARDMEAAFRAMWRAWCLGRVST